MASDALIERMHRLSRAARWRRWHQWLGVTACLGLLLWSLSGLSHPIMVRLQPQAVTFQPPLIESAQAAAMAAPAILLPALGINSVHHLRLINWHEQPVYQVGREMDDTLIYIDAMNGHLIDGGDEAYARLLARHYAGEHQVAIVSTKRIQEFAGEYGAVNRLLPAWRIDFDRPDGLRVYVHTPSSRLGTLVDDRKAVFDWSFRMLHKWAWLQPAEPLRVLVTMVFIIAAFITALTGLVLYFTSWRLTSLTRRGLPAWHRRLGLVVAITTLTFSFSGGYHLLTMVQRGMDASPQLAQAIPVTALATALVSVDDTGGAVWRDASLVDIGGASYYRIALAGNHGHAGHHHHGQDTAQAVTRLPVHYLDTATGAVQSVALQQQRAMQLAQAFSGLTPERITDIQAITAFDGEYGFVNKFLPVWRVEYDTPLQDRYYVEPASGKLAAHINNRDELEGWTFAYLHKWSFMDHFSKDLRDILMALFALGMGSVALLGLGMFLRKRHHGFHH